MAAAEHSSFLPPIVTFCAAAVVAVPAVRLAGLTSVLGYLAAGIVIGPAGLKLITDQASVVSLAELGVVLLLFVIGLELKLSKLLSMKRDIFAGGGAQLLLTAAALALAARIAGLGTAGAIVVGFALAMSSTAVALQMLDERGHLQTDYGQRSFSILLFQDLAIVPILALVPVLGASAGGGTASGAAEVAAAVGAAALALAGVILAGRYVLNPMFRFLATGGAREVMTAAALLVALGSALAMERVGLSMALGAFLAGVLLAESDFKHQLEADIEPFRGLLLGLFFMGVGMGIDPKFVTANGVSLAALALGLIGTKIAVAYVVLRAAGARPRPAIRAAALLAPTGEFAFVILPLAVSALLLNADQTMLVTAAAALTMFLGPLLAKIVETVLARRAATVASSPADTLPDMTPDGASGTVLVIGFGRFGQLVTQVLLAEGVDVVVIDRNVERIRTAGRFGFKVYYGDGSRLDVLRAAGADKARIIAICGDVAAETSTIVDLVHTEFPLARTFARSYDRNHSLELMNLEVDYQMRETLESALRFGEATIVELGVEPERAAEIVEDVRKRDVARLVIQRAEGLMGGLDLIRRGKLEPEPLSAPRNQGEGLSAQTRDAMAATPT